MSEWQPIETAPRDGQQNPRGTIILATRGTRTRNPEVIIGYFYSDPLDENAEINGWWRSNGNGMVDPTHWMPLPEPPEA